MVTAADLAAALADNIGTLTDNGNKIIQGPLPYSGWRAIGNLVTDNDPDFEDNSLKIRRIGHQCEMQFDAGFDTLTIAADFITILAGKTIPVGYRPDSFAAINVPACADDATARGQLSILSNIFFTEGLSVGSVYLGYTTWLCTDDVLAEWPGTLLR